jgi:hypothetical protein
VINHDWAARHDYYAVEALCGEVLGWRQVGGFKIDGGYGSTEIPLITIKNMRSIPKDEAYMLAATLRIRSDMLGKGHSHYVEAVHEFATIRPLWPLVDLSLDEGDTFLCLICFGLLRPDQLGHHTACLPEGGAYVVAMRQHASSKSAGLNGPVLSDGYTAARQNSWSPIWGA